jgi:uncharacterized membrane protein HdeD (DUF308 family)
MYKQLILFGAPAIVWIIGVYAVLFGLLTLILSFRIRRWQKAAAV